MTITTPVAFGNLFISLGGSPREVLADGQILHAGHETVEFAIALEADRERAFDEANFKPFFVPGYLLLLTAEQFETMGRRPSEFFLIDVLDQEGDIVGQIRVNGEPEGTLRSEHGPLAVAAVPFKDVRKGQFIAVSGKDWANRWHVYRTLEDANPQTGKVRFEYTSAGADRKEKPWFELGPNFLCYLVLDQVALLEKLGLDDISAS